MTENKPNLREQFNVLAEKVQAALPNRLLIDLVLSINQDKKSLRIDKTPEANFNGGDIKTITDILKQTFRGDYISAPGGGFYWSVPLFQDVPLPPYAIANQNQERQKAEQKTQPPAPTPIPVQAAPKPEPEKPAPGPQEKPIEEKAPETPSQPSPVTQFLGNMCETCEDRFKGCNLRTDEGKRKMDVCFQVLNLDVQKNLASDLGSLLRTQKETAAFLAQIVIELQKRPIAQASASAPTKPATPAPAPTSTPKPQPPAPPPAPTKPPEQKKLHVDGGILWSDEKGDRGDYEKATEADNRGREEFYKLEDWVRTNKDKPFQETFYYWIFDRGDLAIGRKKCKQTQGRR